jgi:hypothetical protein
MNRQVEMNEERPFKESLPGSFLDAEVILHTMICAIDDEQASGSINNGALLHSGVADSKIGHPL